MSLKQVYFRHFRNFNTLTMMLSPHLNVITGDNGSGKTSILEGIYILSRGKSFRTNQLKQAIQEAQPSFLLTAKKQTIYGSEVVLGLQRTRRTWEDIKINGKKIDRLSQLAKELPVILIEPSSDQLIEGGPSARRRFIDWGVFHVEHRFYSLWSDLQRILKQRNALLAATNFQIDKQQLAYWDQMFVEISDQITQFRQHYLTGITHYFNTYTAKFFTDNDFKLRYLRGWPEGKDLAACLTYNIRTDIKNCRTEYGPHRADLQVLHQGRNIKERLSRGQLKLILFALYFAQIAFMREVHNKVTSLLLDDIFAELDKQHTEKVFKFLLEEDVQTILTSTHLTNANQQQLNHPALFHVEHGQVNVLNSMER